MNARVHARKYSPDPPGSAPLSDMRARPAAGCRLSRASSPRREDLMMADQRLMSLRRQLATAKAVREEAHFAEKLERARAEGRAIIGAATETAVGPLRTIDTKCMGANEKDRERNLLLAIAVDKDYLEARSELAEAEREVAMLEAEIEAVYFAGRLRDLEVREKALMLAQDTGAAAWEKTAVPA